MLLVGCSQTASVLQVRQRDQSSLVLFASKETSGSISWMAQTSHCIHQIQKVLCFILRKEPLLCGRLQADRGTLASCVCFLGIVSSLGPGKRLCSAGLHGIPGSPVHIHHVLSGVVWPAGATLYSASQCGSVPAPVQKPHARWFPQGTCTSIPRDPPLFEMELYH